MTRLLTVSLFVVAATVGCDLLKPSVSCTETEFIVEEGGFDSRRIGLGSEGERAGMADVSVLRTHDQVVVLAIPLIGHELTEAAVCVTATPADSRRCRRWTRSSPGPGGAIYVVVPEEDIEPRMCSMRYRVHVRLSSRPVG